MPGGFQSSSAGRTVPTPGRRLGRPTLEAALGTPPDASDRRSRDSQRHGYHRTPQDRADADQPGAANRRGGADAPAAQALADTPSWDGTIDVPPPDVLPPSVAPHDDDATGATSTVLMMLGCGVWPFVAILAGLALIVPFLAGLIVVGVAGAVVFAPYWLVRRWRRGRHADEPAA